MTYILTLPRTNKRLIAMIANELFDKFLLLLEGLQMFGITIESDLKEILSRFEQKLDNLQKDITKLKIDMALVKTKIDGLDNNIKGLEDDIKDIKGSQKAQIWTLIGIVGTALLGTIARYSASKWVVQAPSPPTPLPPGARGERKLFKSFRFTM